MVIEGRDKFLILFVLVMLGLGGLFEYKYTVMHEEIHGKICLWSGGKPNITYHWSPLKRSRTYCENKMDGNMPDDVELNLKNEIVGYNMYWLGVVVFACSLLIGMTNLMRFEE